MIQPLSCDNHESNQLNCVECTIKRTVFYENALQDAVLYPEEFDDDDERPVNPESFDGGYGNGSYFQHAMRKND